MTLTTIKKAAKLMGYKVFDNTCDEGIFVGETGKVNEVGGPLFASQYSPNNGVKVGDIVYTIKQKGKKDGN